MTHMHLLFYIRRHGFMKRNLVLMLLVLALLIPSTSMAAKNNVIVKIDGVVLDTEGVSPYIKEGTTFVPIRAISEALDYEVDWDGTNRVVIMKRDNTTVKLPIGKKVVTVNGVSREIPKAAEIKKSTTYVPVRFVSEIIDYEVYFKKDGGKSIIDIISPKVEQPGDEIKDESILEDVLEDLGRLDNLGDDHLFSYFLDYPSLNKVLGMKPTKSVDTKMSDYYACNYYEYDKAPKEEDACKYEVHISDMDKAGELKVKYDFKFEPLGDSPKVKLEHTYKWNNGKWELIDAKIKSLSPKEFKVTEFKYRDKKEYKSWYKNEVLNVTKGNVDKLFGASKNEIQRICGKPKEIKTYDCWPGDEFYEYNGFNVSYIGGNSKYSWGPGQILFTGGNSKLLGVKVGMSLNEAKKIVGKPSFEGIDDCEGDYLLIYEFNGYEYYYYIDSGNKVATMNVKQVPNY